MNQLESGTSSTVLMFTATLVDVLAGTEERVLGDVVQLADLDTRTADGILRFGIAPDRIVTIEPRPVAAVVTSAALASASAVTVLNSDRSVNFIVPIVPAVSACGSKTPC